MSLSYLLTIRNTIAANERYENDTLASIDKKIRDACEERKAYVASSVYSFGWKDELHSVKSQVAGYQLDFLLRFKPVAEGVKAFPVVELSLLNSLDKNYFKMSCRERLSEEFNQWIKGKFREILGVTNVEDV